MKKAALLFAAMAVFSAAGVNAEELTTGNQVVVPVVQSETKAVETVQTEEVKTEEVKTEEVSEVKTEAPAAEQAVEEKTEAAEEAKTEAVEENAPVKQTSKAKKTR